MLDNTLNQPSKFKTKNLVEINDDSSRTCNTISQINLRLDKGTITVPSAAVSSAVADNNGTGVIFKNCPPFTDSITEISNI